MYSSDSVVSFNTMSQERERDGGALFCSVLFLLWRLLSVHFSQTVLTAGSRFFFKLISANVWREIWTSGRVDRQKQRAEGAGIKRFSFYGGFSRGMYELTARRKKRSQRRWKDHLSPRLQSHDKIHLLPLFTCQHNRSLPLTASSVALSPLF